KKTRLIEVLRRLQAHKLVEVNSQDLSDMEGIIILYPSLAMSVDRDSIDELLASLAHKGKAGEGDPPEEAPGTALRKIEKGENRRNLSR
ncbi:MAG: hypothetical protein LBP76_14080, partial [Treponema sp.]|nr:hypothetical protein [Treponema sp.]